MKPILEPGTLVSLRESGKTAVILNLGDDPNNVEILELEQESNSNFLAKVDSQWGAFFINRPKRSIINLEDVHESIGSLEKYRFKEVYSTLLKSDMKHFYDNFHKQSRQTFRPGTHKIGFAGRVYDHNEMQNLLESNLRFYLTGEIFDLKFNQGLSKYISPTEKIHSLTVNSGSSANLLALSALTSHKLGQNRLKPGDEVITVAAGFPTTVAPIFQNKLIPVFVDIELETYNINTQLLEQAITSKTKAIFIAHTLGFPFDLNTVLNIAEKYNLWVIEDCCDALGAEYTLDRQYKLKDNHIVSGLHKVGNFGHIGTASFYPAHQMTMGEGGAVFTKIEELRKILLSFRDWGRDCYCDPGKDNTCKKRFSYQLGGLPHGYDHKYTYSHLGYNLKITDMQAAVGCAQLDKLPGFVESRLKNWNYLKESLSDLEKYFILPKISANSKPSPFGFVLTVRPESGINRNSITQFLEDKKIQTRVVFAGNMLKQPAIYEDDLNYRVISDLPNTSIVMENTFWVGVYPGLDKNKLDYMIDAIRQSIHDREL